MKTAEAKALHEWIVFQFPASQGNLELPRLIAKVEAAGRRDGMTEAANVVLRYPSADHAQLRTAILAARDAKTSGP